VQKKRTAGGRGFTEGRKRERVSKRGSEKHKPKQTNGSNKICAGKRTPTAMTITLEKKGKTGVTGERGRREIHDKPRIESEGKGGGGEGIILA